MDDPGRLVHALREVLSGLSAPAGSSVSMVDRVELFGAPYPARVQVVYFAGEDVRFGVGEDIPEFDSELELEQFLTGFFCERLQEPNDTTRGLWVDGVWWWTPGTTPVERPRVDGLVVVRQGDWASG